VALTAITAVQQCTIYSCTRLTTLTTLVVTFEQIACLSVYTEKHALLSSFQQCYYFRNLFYLTRPGLIPVERGGLVQQWNRGWRVYVTDGNDKNMGPGR
jgi:hypothetical protein